MFWLSAAGLVAVVVTLGYTHALFRTTVDSSQRSLRAYVSIAGVEIRRFATTEPLDVVIKVDNRGQTPAYGLEARVALVLAPPPGPKHPPGLEKLGANVLVGPEHVYDLHFPRTLTPEERASVVAGELSIYIWAEITHRDAFNEPRQTRYRGAYIARGVAPPEPIVVGEEEETIEAD